MSEPSTEPTVLIPAGTERRAMDWSLTLTSQEIEVGIEKESSSGRWMLRVRAEDEGRARDTLRKFFQENRGWSLRFNSLGEEWPLQLDWAALVWVSFMALLHGLGAAPAHNTLFQPRAFESGEWWRAFTATWLHADLGHLAMNAIFGGLLMGLAMGRYGAGLAAASTLAAGALANAIAPVFRPGDYIGLGASGVVMAALGMLTTNLTVLWNTRFPRHPLDRSRSRRRHLPLPHARHGSQGRCPGPHPRLPPRPARRLCRLLDPIPTPVPFLAHRLDPGSPPDLAAMGLGLVPLIRKLGAHDRRNLRNLRLQLPFRSYIRGCPATGFTTRNRNHTSSGVNHVAKNRS